MRKITLLMMLLVAIVATAKADITQTYVKTDNGAFWGTAITEYPQGVTDAKPSNAASVFVHKEIVLINSESNITVGFEHKTGNHGLNVLGVDLFNTSVRYSSYSHKIAGGGNNSGRKDYTMNNVAPGVYTLRYFVCNIDGSDQVAQAGGNVTIIGDVTITNADNAVELERNSWSVTASSQETTGDPGQATNAIDGTGSTFWHTQYKVTEYDVPHWIEFDMKAPTNICKFNYVSRFDRTNANGNILEYELYISDSPMNGTFDNATKAAEGTFTYGNNSDNNVQGHHTITLPNVVKGQYIALKAISATRGNWMTSTKQYANCAEFYVYGIDDGNNLAKSALKVALDNCIEYYNTGMIGVHAGQYSTSQDFMAVYQAGETYYANITDETSVDEINAEKNKINELIASFTLNMPLSGDIYTFETSRGWLCSNTSDYAWCSGRSGSGITPSTDNENCQWVYYEGAKGKYLYNVAKGKFITYGNTDNNIPFGAIPNDGSIEFRYSTKDGYPYLMGFKGRVINMNTDSGNSFQYGALLWQQGWTNSQNSGDDGSAMKITFIDEADEATLATVAKLVSAFEDAPYTLTVTGAGYATLFLGYDAAIPEFEGENGVYIATGMTTPGYIHLEKVTGVLPANTGVIVKANEGEYTFVYSTSTLADVRNNLLRGSVNNEYVQGDAFVLGIPEGETEVALCPAMLNKNENGEAGETHFLNNANKAYLPNNPGAAMSTSLRFDFGGTTGIEEIEVENDVKVIYDLTGRRVNDITEKGIYIVNGNKVLVK